MLLTVATLLLADPLRLGIGRKGELTIEPGTLVDLRTEKVAHLSDVVQAAKRSRFVFVGESHATAPHQQFEADLVQGFAKSRPVAVGVEFITRPKQSVLDDWTRGRLAEPEFLAAVDWKGQWGFDYALYRPLFEICRTASLPLVGLNLPRDWVRAVGRGGQTALTPEQRTELPSRMPLDFSSHRKIFESFMGGHPITGEKGENMYAAQVLWDEGMADTAVKSLPRLEKGGIMVVVAGAAHVMYGQGISLRVKRQIGEKGIHVVMVDSDEPVTVSRGIADFVYVSKNTGKASAL